MDLISIIVPVYNVAPYLQKCLDSILAQTYTNLEIICVDDGSTDTSGAIVDAYAKIDARVRVIHQMNGGLSDARNIGVGVATGAYIGFVDSDDYIAPQMYETLYNFATQNDLDVAMCCAYDVCDGKVCGGTKNFAPIVTESPEEMIRLLFLPHRNGAQIGVWIKLFRRSVAGNVSFRVGKAYEDVFYVLDCIERTRRFGWICNAFYYYVQRAGSITHLPRFKPAILDVVEGYEENYARIAQHWPGAMDAARHRLAWSYLVCLNRIADCADWRERRAEMETVRGKARARLGEFMASPGVTLKMKIMLLLVALDLDLYFAVKKLYKRLKERKHTTCTPPLY
ncbi:MAG: glycosyltransferase [Phascolarctobacterium sp.]|uniref:glycosyltransferase n=1 Tax=Phascolarctobacterium sp. TaxID=2049039 RepID=UPI0026DB689A|nr:glycosyltransferase [Phascolarctobacterium sp.]MDO4921927.1 glycosyltransferase [Phascolarctobacterium sp.]